MAQELAESILSPSTNSGQALSKGSNSLRREVDSGRKLRRAQRRRLENLRNEVTGERSPGNYSDVFSLVISFI